MSCFKHPNFSSDLFRNSYFGLGAAFSNWGISLCSVCVACCPSPFPFICLRDSKLKQYQEVTFFFFKLKSWEAFFENISLALLYGGISYGPGLCYQPLRLCDWVLSFLSDAHWKKSLPSVSGAGVLARIGLGSPWGQIKWGLLRNGATELEQIKDKKN